jgi:hypothetical protein
MSKTLTIQRDRQYLAREEPAEGLRFTRSESCFIFDQHGKKYRWLGRGQSRLGNEEIRAAVRDDAGPARDGRTALARFPSADDALTLVQIAAIAVATAAPRVGTALALLCVAFFLLPQSKPRYKPGEEPTAQKKLKE